MFQLKREERSRKTVISFRFLSVFFLSNVEVSIPASKSKRICAYSSLLTE